MKTQLVSSRLLAIGAACAAVVGLALPAAPPVGAEELEIGGVWWNVQLKPERGRAKENREKGTLTLGADGILRFVGGKHDLAIPLDEVSWIHARRVRDRDDLDWVVLEVARERIHLIRDGRKFGFGKRTPEILQALVAPVREAGSGQFRAPEGRRAFTQLDSRTVFTLPDGWNVEKRVEEFRDGRLVAGRVIFGPEGADGAHGARGVGAGGRGPRLELELWPAPRGARCAGLTPADLEEVRGPEAGPAEEVEVGRCRGLRWTAGDRVRVAVAHGETLYAMSGLAAPGGEDGLDAAARALDAAVADWRFPLLP